jgi:hypothetical protein
VKELFELLARTGLELYVRERQESFIVTLSTEEDDKRTESCFAKDASLNDLLPVLRTDAAALDRVLTANECWRQFEDAEREGAE